MMLGRILLTDQLIRGESQLDVRADGRTGSSSHSTELPYLLEPLLRDKRMMMSLSLFLFPIYPLAVTAMSSIMQIFLILPRKTEVSSSTQK